MPLDLKCYPEFSLLHVIGEEKIQHEDAQEAYRQCRKTNCCSDIEKVLIDFRRVSSYDMTTHELLTFIPTLQCVPVIETAKRAVVISKASDFVRFKLWKVSSTNEPFEANIFFKFEIALSWLYPMNHFVLDYFKSEGLLTNGGKIKSHDFSRSLSSENNTETTYKFTHSRKH